MTAGQGGTRAWLRRAALGLWLLAIAVLGALQFGMRAFDHGDFTPTTIAWLWLCGSALMGLIAVVLLVRACRQPG